MRNQLNVVPMLAASLIALCWNVPSNFVRAAEAAAPVETPEARAELSGAQILERSARSYQALQYYQGTTAVITTADMGVRKSAQTASEEISFARPGKFHIEGHDTSGDRFRITSEGEKAWLSWPLIEDGAVREEPSMEAAAGSLGGTASKPLNVIPAALMSLGWGNPFEKVQAPEVRGHESIGGEDCFKVVSDTFLAKRSFWISSHDFLLRQLQVERDEDQMSNTLGPGYLPAPPPGMDAAQYKEMTKSIKFNRMTSLCVFIIDSADKPIPDRYFERPKTPEPKTR